MTTYNKNWSKQEDEILRHYYPMMGVSVQKMLPNRSKDAVVSHANRLGLKMLPLEQRIRRWEIKEDEIIKQNYPTMGLKIKELLSDRTEKEVLDRVKILGVKYQNSKPWSEDEDNVIRKYYPKLGSKTASLFENRSENAVVRRAGKLGVKMDFSGKAREIKKWTKEEDEIIKKYYADLGAAITERLPNRTISAIQARAAKLGIKREGSNYTKRWSEKEDQILIKKYPRCGLEVKNELPGKTEEQILRRAKKLGVDYEFAEYRFLKSIFGDYIE